MRANDGALVTLDTLSSIPYRNVYCSTTLLVSSCTLRECTIFHTNECGYRERVTFLSVHYVNNLLDELRNSLLLNRLILSCLPGIRNVNCNNCINTSVDSSIVHLNDIVTLLTVRLESCLLHVVNSLVNRKDSGKLEECGLADCVDSSAEADLLSLSNSVKSIELDVVVSDISLHRTGESLLEFFSCPLCVEEECSAGLQC